jgi:hypothetical protein
VRAYLEVRMREALDAHVGAAIRITADGELCPEEARGAMMRQWPESPDGSFWVEWREWDRGGRDTQHAWARSQLGGVAQYRVIAVDRWIFKSWTPSVSGRLAQ